MAETFSYTPDHGASAVTAPKVNVVNFGDGYEQRQMIGLPAQQIKKTWQLRWSAKNSTDADAIETFFINRAKDGEYFNWQPLDESSTSKWVCETWSRNFQYSGVHTITATFKQVFDLA
jgi:phage-related protein